LFPVMAGFFLMVTALTYQLRGWLASLMENKRRRRTIVTLLTMIVVLIFQVPNLLNFYRFGGPKRAPSSVARRDTVERTARTANTLIPIGWLPYSAATLLEGRIFPSVLATLGLTLIGSGSLVRCYGTTLRLYTGQFKARKSHGPTPAVRKEVKSR